MKKWIFVVIGLILIMICSCGYFSSNNFNSQVVVNYNGNSLMISIDGATSTTLPTTGIYYLTNYGCDNNNTKVTWDSTSYELVVSNGKEGGGVSCDLTFKSNPLLNEMPVGSYVAYEGVGGTVGTTSVECQNDDSISSVAGETESPYSCLGRNASEGADTNGNTYGYCDSANYKYYTTGWRIAYIDTTNNKAVIISAGSPECNTRIAEAYNAHYIKAANALALKYCNPEFVDGDSNGNKCTCTSTTSGMCDEASVDAWAINDITFNKMTEQATGVTGGGYLYDSITGVTGATKCGGGVSSTEVCGYNNDLIDNGGYYWFAAANGSSTYGVSWSPSARGVYYDAGMATIGLRPVISLSSSVYVTGGLGTMESHYTISNS